jgi:hypothetical protein
MKYFTPELAAASISGNPKWRAEAHREFSRRSRAYHRELERLRGRVSRKAWEFFRYGFGRTGLHDANLIFFTAGDGLNYCVDGKQPYRVNHQPAEVRIQFLNRTQDLVHAFTFRAVRRIECNLPTELRANNWSRSSIDMLTTYEFTSPEKGFLRAEFLFISDGHILVDFKKLIYSKKRVKRTYPTSSRYD